MEISYQSLLSKGYTREEISLIMSEETRKKFEPNTAKTLELENTAASDIGKNTAMGGTIGAVAGFAVALGASIILPGVGILLAGPLAVGLAGTAAGGVSGGVIGALVGSGIAEEHAIEYENEVINGRIVLGIHPHTDEDGDFFEQLWRDNKAEIIFRQRAPMGV